MATKTKSNRIVGMMDASMRDYQAEDDLRHLTNAHKIKKDPKRHGAAMKLAKARLAEMHEVANPAAKK